VQSLALEADDYDVLQEILVRAYAAGWRVREVPIAYAPNPAVASKAHLPLVAGYLRTFWGLWKLRNSIKAADYDYRAHDSVIPLQRYWQRSRFKHVTELIAGEGRVLDIGCGSSRIIAALPPGSVAVDILQRKLRYARRFERALVHASGFALPFPDQSFPCVLCSQVIEHVPKESPILDELIRVLAPGGRLVLGTPDYANWQWVYIEKLYGMVPGGYKDEHITHYTQRSLSELAAAHGLEVSGHCAPYLHLHAAAATPNFRHLEWFHDHVRIEQMCFEGAADPFGGAVVMNAAAPGNGLNFRADAIERFRVR